MHGVLIAATKAKHKEALPLCHSATLPLCHFATLHLPPQHLCPLSNYLFKHAHIQKTPRPPPGSNYHRV